MVVSDAPKNIRIDFIFTWMRVQQDGIAQGKTISNE